MVNRDLKGKLKVGQEVAIARINDSVRVLRREEGCLVPKDNPDLIKVKEV